MESSAPKRRRVSPRTAAAVDSGGVGASTTHPVPPTGPAVRSSRVSTTPASPVRDSRRSNASPRSEGRAGEETEPGPSRPTSRGSYADVEGLLSAQLEGEDEPGTGGRSAEDATAHPTAGSSRSALADPARTSAAKKSSGGLSAPPKRSPVRPTPRPLPPPGPIADEDILNPFAGRGLRRSGLGVLPPREARPEPELPPTPEHPGPELTTPPAGIHKTPSKKARRSKGLADRIKNSPLKKPPAKPTALEAGGATAPDTALRSPPGESRNKSALHANAARGVKPFDPDAGKKKTRDALLAKVAQLERDLAVAAGENHRIHQAGLAKAEIPPPPNGDQILRILRRNVVPRDERAPDPTRAWLQTAMDPVACLPFGKAGLSLQGLFDQETLPEAEEPPPSHQPIKMTAEEELPYLQTFSSLKLSSRITMLPRESEDEPVLQKHSITATSAKPPGVFSAQIDMTVDTAALVITDLSVPRLDPASYSELNPLIERVLDISEPDSALTRNVNVLGWAMGEWLRVSLRRARFWVLLDKQLGTANALAESISQVRSQRKRKRRRGGNEGDEAEDDDVLQTTEDPTTVSRAELLPQMGRTSMDLDIPSTDDEEGSKTTLRVLWRIEFDWAGEAQSRLGVLVDVPGKWHGADEGGGLRGVPELFDRLVQGNEDPAAAVKTIVTLLAGDEITRS